MGRRENKKEIYGVTKKEAQKGGIYLFLYLGPFFVDPLITQRTKAWLRIFSGYSCYLFHSLPKTQSMQVQTVQCPGQERIGRLQNG